MLFLADGEANRVHVHKCATWQKNISTRKIKLPKSKISSSNHFVSSTPTQIISMKLDQLCSIQSNPLP